MHVQSLEEEHEIYRGKTRPDMAVGCKEKMDMEFAKWVWRFPQDIRAAYPRHIKGRQKYRYMHFKKS